MAYADENDVSVAIGRTLSNDEVLQVRQWIADAEMLIAIRLGDLTKLNSAAVGYVAREAAVNRLRNPEGFTSETIDDYTYRHGSETRQVTILDEWWNLLDPDSSSGSGSVRPGFEPDLIHWSVRTVPWREDGFCW